MISVVKKPNIVNIFLFIIILLALFLRSYKLGEIPNGLSWDEAAQGYNAFTLSETGKDEFGKTWPVSFFESFGDFKPVLYTYSAIIPIKIWGLNEFSTRFPSAFFGTITVLITFFLVLEIFHKSEKKKIIALLSTFFLAISPWHIQMSRAAFEANLGLFWIVLGIYLLLKGINGKTIYVPISAVPFAATFYTFNSTRVFTPIILLIIAVINIKEWKKYWKSAILFFIFFVILLIPILPHLLSPQAKLRFNEVNIFSDLKPIEQSNVRMEVDNNTWWSRILHNRRWMFSMEYLRHYLDNLNLRFLFLVGDGNPKFSIQDVGQMYLVNLPFFLFGLLFLIRKYKNERLLILLWLLGGIIPAGTARETPHALRILQTLPCWQIIISIGWLESYLIIKNKKLGHLLYSILIFLLLFNAIWYLHNYYYHYPKEYAGEWQYGYKDAIEYINTNYNKYDHVVFTENMGRPYIFFLFFNKYNNNDFLKTADIKRDAFGFVNVRGFNKYLFGSEDKLLPGKTLYSVSPQNLPKGKKPIKIIYLPNGNPVLMMYEN